MEPPAMNFDSTDAYNKLYGLPTRHPLVAVMNRLVNHDKVIWPV